MRDLGRRCLEPTPYLIMLSIALYTSHSDTFIVHVAFPTIFSLLVEANLPVKCALRGKSYNYLPTMWLESNIHTLPSSQLGNWRTSHAAELRFTTENRLYSRSWRMACEHCPAAFPLYLSATADPCAVSSLSLPSHHRSILSQPYSGLYSTECP